MVTLTHRKARWRTMTRAIFIAAILVSGTAWARPAARIILNPAPNQVFSVPQAQGEVTCVLVRNKWKVASRNRRGQLIDVGARIAQIRRQMTSATPAVARRLAKERSSLSRYQRRATPVCRAGPPPPPPPPDLFAPKTSPSTEWDVRYLYEKVALGAVPPEAFTRFQTGGIQAVVEYLTTYRPDPALTIDAERWLDNNYDSNVNGSGQPLPIRPEGLQQYALHHLLNTDNPFFDRFAYLFLHNLLATSSDALPWDQQRPFFRDHLNRLRARSIDGDYRQLLREMTVIDGAMLHWLDGRTNVASEPNENYARELLELFTMGPVNRVTGERNYSEVDVARVAQGLAGYTTVYNTVNQVFEVGRRGAGSMYLAPLTIFAGTPWQATVQGQQFPPEPPALQIVDATFRHPGTKYFLAYRILKEHVTENPSVEHIKALGDYLESQDFNMLLTMRKLLASEYFYAPAHRDTIITMPTDRVVSFLRRTKIPARTDTVRWTLRNTGHVLSRPRTVFGWDSLDFAHTGWQISTVNAATFILRDDSFFNQIPAGQTEPRFRFHRLLPNGQNTQDIELIEHFGKICNLPTITLEERQRYLRYLNDWGTCNTVTETCSGSVPRRFDARLDGTNGTENMMRIKVSGLVRMMCMLHPRIETR